MSVTASQPRKRPAKIYSSAGSSGMSSGSQGNSSEGESSSQEKVPKVVIRNVKDAHQCHDWGEAQEHKGDLEYLLEGLSVDNSDNLKCLSMIKLMKKCLSTPFRQFVRSKGGIATLFQTVIDSLDYSPLTICTSGVIYILSRDRLGLAVDDNGLKVLVRLMRHRVPESGEPDKEVYDKYKDQVWTLLSEWRSLIQSSSSEFMFDVTKENITPFFLTVESLVFISARCSDPKFKEGLMRFGGLQFITTSLLDSIDALPEDGSINEESLEPLKLIQRYLRILEYVTVNCSKVQKFLISHRDCVILNACARLLSFFQAAIPKHLKKNPTSPGANKSEKDEPVKWEGELVSALMALVRLCCNLSNDNELCCSRFGTTDLFFDTLLSMLTWMEPAYLPDNKLFDLIFLELGLLINLVERNGDNRRLILGLRTKVWPPVKTGKKVSEDELPALEALVTLFLRHSAKAQAIDDDIGKELMEEAEIVRVRSANKRPAAMEKELEATVGNALNKAGKHMEDTIMASYLALFVGFLLPENEQEADTVKRMLPNGKLSPMIESLKTFQDFMELTEACTPKGQEGFKKILKLFNELDTQT